MAEEEKKEKRGLFSRMFGGKKKEEAAEQETIEGEGETPGEEEEAPVEEVAPEESVCETALEEPEEEEFLEESPTILPEEPEADEEPAEVAEGADTELEEEPQTETEELSGKKTGFFSRLKNQLGKTRKSMVEKIRDVTRLHGKVDEELLEEIETILIQADVGVDTTMKIVDILRKKKDAKKAEDADSLIAVFKESIMEIVDHEAAQIALQPQNPTVIMVTGVNGVGKTTTIGKMAREYRNQGKRVMLVAADTFRAAAIDQLAIWAKQAEAEFVAKEMGSDPGAVCYEALSRSDIANFDVVLIDTAGRLHTRSALMDELNKIKRVIQKVMPEAPHETLLVLDATTGQNAMNQAAIFNDVVQLSGLIMTKLDGTAKGGILIAVRDRFDLPILKIGIGEQEGDLRDFQPRDFVDALFSNGDG